MAARGSAPLTADLPSFVHGRGQGSVRPAGEGVRIEGQTDIYAQALLARLDHAAAKHAAVAKAEAERDEAIAAASVAGLSLRAIAERLGMSKSWVAKRLATRA